MTGLDVNSSSSVCRRCGTAYGRMKGYFAVSYGALYKGVGYLPYCKECVDAMYLEYLDESKEPRMAARQMCRKLDLYWNDKIFDMVEKQNTTRTIMTQYIAKLTAIKYAGKSYDDTLKEEGMFWEWPDSSNINSYRVNVADVPEDSGCEEIPDDMVAFWGPGYDSEMYFKLQERYDYFVSELPSGVSLDIGTKTLIRQICGLELEIIEDTAAGKGTDKKRATLNSLLNNSLLKPAQKRDDIDEDTERTPFGVWIDKWENKRPVPDPDPDFEDVDHVVKYISTWFLGHLCKMLGIKNAYCKLYDDEIERLRISRPEYEEDDDETLFNDIFASDSAQDGD